MRSLTGARETSLHGLCSSFAEPQQRRCKRLAAGGAAFGASSAAISAHHRLGPSAVLTSVAGRALRGAGGLGASPKASAGTWAPAARSRRAIRRSHLNWRSDIRISAPPLLQALPRVLQEMPLAFAEPGALAGRHVRVKRLRDLQQLAERFRPALQRGLRQRPLLRGRYAGDGTSLRHDPVPYSPARKPARSNLALPIAPLPPWLPGRASRAVPPHQDGQYCAGWSVL